MEIGLSDDTGGEDDSFEPKDTQLRMFGSAGNNGAVRHSGIFRGESQNDPSRSNSLMSSENSSQPDMHPFYKVHHQITFPSSECVSKYIYIYFTTNIFVLCNHIGSYREIYCII